MGRTAALCMVSMLLMMLLLADVGVAQNSSTAAVSTTIAPVTPSGGTTSPPSSSTTTPPATGGNGTASPGGITTTASPSSSDSTGSSIQWYHFFIMITIGFVLLGAACYVTLMWQQNAIRDYKNVYEEIVKRVGLKRGELAKSIKAAKKDAAKRGAAPVVRDPLEDDEEDEKANAAAAAAAHHNQAAALLVGGVDRTGPLFGRLQMARIRGAARETEAQRRASENIDILMRRTQREAAERERAETLNNVSLLGRAVVESTSVDHSIQSLERRSQWRSLRSLDLSTQDPHSTSRPGAVSRANQGADDVPADATSINMMTPSSRGLSGPNNSSFYRSSSRGDRTTRYTTDGMSSADLMSSPGHRTHRSNSSAPSVLEL